MQLAVGTDIQREHVARPLGRQVRSATLLAEQRPAPPTRRDNLRMPAVWTLQINRHLTDSFVILRPLEPTFFPIGLRHRRGRRARQAAAWWILHPL